MRHFPRPPLLAALLVALAAPNIMAAPPVVPISLDGRPINYDYVELAEMALAAPLAIAAEIDRAIALKGAQAEGVASGNTRYYVEANVTGLIRGQTAVPPRISYLIDLPTPTGRKPKLKGLPVLLLASQAGGPSELRLIGPRAQVPRTPENESRLRAILTASVAADAPPVITGITRAFHVPGSLPGESETQIFLSTADNRPVSLNVLRRPGEEPRWAVALTELVDASAEPPQRDTLLWYRLACALPPAIPARATIGLSDSEETAIRNDYKVVLDGLGPCKR
ncbi:hypothetical protein [Sphingomonas sp.]|uniref:hypothetical protein n=1 Tax=Sphingomonas sp. TaxID=28214 RepID=UPI003B3BC9F6